MKELLRCIKCNKKGKFLHNYCFSCIYQFNKKSKYSKWIRVKDSLPQEEYEEINIKELEMTHWMDLPEIPE